MDLLKQFIKSPVLAIMRKITLEDTIDYAGVAVEAGISFIEVALNSPKALEQIQILRKHFGSNACIGAGTAITVDLVRQAREAGAQFFLTPGTPLSVMEYCSKEELALLPGVYTPTDVATALSYGYNTLKLFPAGGAPKGYVKALAGPFDDINLVAVGGVTPENINEFFAEGYVGVGIASNLMPADIVAAKHWAEGRTYIESFMKKIDLSLRKI